MKSFDRKCNLTRRQFMAITGGAASIAAFSAIGLSMERRNYTPNISEIDLGDMRSVDLETDVLVVGSGMAGVFASVKAHDAGARVLVVSKGRLGASGQAPFARGIFSYDPKTATMSIDEFVAAVSHSAMGTNNPVFTRQMAIHSFDRVQELKEWGFFNSPLYHDAFKKPIEERKIRVIERVMLTHLVEVQGRVVGAAGFSMDDTQLYCITAKSVILCTGAGGFKPNGFPICDLTHDGTMMAYEIGAEITGKEWNDGHPSNLENPASVYDQWGGMFKSVPHTTNIGVCHNLGVELNYSVYMQGPMHDESDQPFFHREKVAGGPQRPSGFANPDGPPPPPPGSAGERKGPPPGMGGIPSGGASAGMSIHKAEGLVPLSERCDTSIPGLFAAGDALGSHMAGGIYTQNGSSLAGSAVQGAIAGESAAAYVEGMPLPRVTKNKWQQIEEQMLAPLKRERGYSPAWVTQTLQGIMIPNFVLYIKKEKMMRAALAYIEELREHHQPLLRAADMHELRLAHETANMLLNAEMKLRASLFRQESRCSHFRLDCQAVDNKNWDCWIHIFKGKEGQMILKKQPFSAWSAG
ncbi:FAD-dependent oxidoreductase [Desulfopila aestuarii]|uniref:Succinate dehydrogenase/fumarate reductase, flavoprotein subunit n=1 Tax=Desulfopila aestuarii DSM 18488 TaxID=1121416 RepID=A0A1M7YBE0_9BACT|nr:FAD-binding protein [Desulfopila aestuarii]SHO49922.1 Succinate dehydrogenase/fumarate reductase, flavoprotein subunit [Desulfopila aestuarii DSM 18488]